MSFITTHVLDLMLGKPARGVGVLLESMQSDGWRFVARSETDPDGRVKGLVPADWPPAGGTYRLTFFTGAYFAAHHTAGFYPEVAVVFEVRDASQHHHVPLLLSPHGYSTYRGS